MLQLIAWMDSSFGNHIEWKEVLLAGFTPVFLMAFAIERQVMRRRGNLRQFAWPDILTNAVLGGAYQLCELALHALFLGAVIFWFWRHRLCTVPVNLATLPAIFVAVEFCYYWFHRSSHRVRWFWSAHVVHHSGEHMNMTTAMRQSVLYPLTGWWLFFMPLVLLGVHPAVVFVLYGCDLAYQFFIHTEAVSKLHPLIEFIFDTPSKHRVHHGRNPRYIDKNYGGVLIIFDRLFGTCQDEVEAVDYGIVRQLRSRNPLLLNFHEFLDMWRDVLRPGTLAQRLRHLWMPPEYVRQANK